MSENYYFDNSRYYFEYVKDKSDYKHVLLCKNKNLYNSLKSKGYNNVYYANTLTALCIFLRSKTVLISYGISSGGFLPYYLSPRFKTIIYLGHGVPMKYLSLQTPVWRKNAKHFQLQKYSISIACSDIEKLIHAACFNIYNKDVWATGLPRNDYLLSDNNQNPQLLAKYPFLAKNIILYAPTWREEGRSTEFFPFEDYDIDKLHGFLESTDSYILVRGHKEDVRMDNFSSKKNYFESDRIISANQDMCEDVYQLLTFVDVLITDYSSLWIDFLLLDRPIIYFPYDLVDYLDYKGLVFEFEKYTAGEKIYSQESFIESLHKYISGEDLYAEKRKEIRDFYHKFQDGRSSERIYNMIRSQLK
jgi:CDP-glycerol glycerophosphotransferase (TagB/SpsB family)